MHVLRAGNAVVDARQKTLESVVVVMHCSYYSIVTTTNPPQFDVVHVLRAGNAVVDARQKALESVVVVIAFPVRVVPGDLALQQVLQHS